MKKNWGCGERVMCRADKKMKTNSEVDGQHLTDKGLSGEEAQTRLLGGWRRLFRNIFPTNITK